MTTNAQGKGNNHAQGNQTKTNHISKAKTNMPKTNRKKPGVPLSQAWDGSGGKSFLVPQKDLGEVHLGIFLFFGNGTFPKTEWNQQHQSELDGMEFPPVKGKEGTRMASIMSNSTRAHFTPLIS